jgi:hypothetical protein
MFRWNRNKQKINRNILIRSIFCYFKKKISFFSGFFGLFQNSLFWLFCFYIATESFDVLIEPKQTEDPPKQFEIEHIWVFSENLGLFRRFGLFRFVTKQFCLFWLFWYRLKHWNKPKQTEAFCFLFHETNRNTTETDLVSVCFGSNRSTRACARRTRNNK